MIDTHAHVHLPQYAADRAQVVARNFAIGLTGFLEVNISFRGWPSVKRLIEGDPRIVGTVGIHPHEAARETISDLRALEPELDHGAAIAVGETGLDTYRDYAPIEAQQKLFRYQIGWARETGLPLVLHCRSTFPEVFAALDEEGGGEVGGVFHCFSGGLPELKEVVARGFYVGLGGAVTYSPDRWARILPHLPLDRLLFETDCPYLRPAPDRKGRNEPAMVFLVAEQVAEMLGRPAIELERLADENADRLFGLPEAMVGSTGESS